MQQIFRQWIGMHRAMIAWYHAAHHVTKGTGFGGDHVNIYGEIYTQLDEDLDQIVEKGIGLTGDETLADPVSSLSLAATKLAQYPAAANQDAETIASHAFALSKEYIDFIESIYSQFEACGMSLGLDDLLQGLANQYETYVYLLQQRSRTASLNKSHVSNTVLENKNRLKSILRKVIQEHYDFENEEGDIRPDRMKEYNDYYQEVIYVLEYFKGWKGLTYGFISDQVSKEIRPFNPDMLERAIYGLISNEEIIEFKGMWNTMQDPPGHKTGVRARRTLYKLSENYDANK